MANRKQQHRTFRNEDEALRFLERRHRKAQSPRSTPSHRKLRKGHLLTLKIKRSSSRK